MKAYQIPIILTIPADSWEEACKAAEETADSLTDAGIGVSLELEITDRDGSDANQRVLYLHDENEPLEID